VFQLHKVMPKVCWASANAGGLQTLKTKVSGSYKQLQLHGRFLLQQSAQTSRSPRSTTKALDDSVLIWQVLLNLCSHVEYGTISTTTKQVGHIF